MEYQNGQFLSAYTKNDTLFEGNVYTRLDGTKVVLNEDKKWLPISELKEIRLIQEATDDDEDIQKLVDVDIGKCDIDKLSSLDDNTLGKVGDNRENELIKSGIKIKKGDYSTRFTNSVKANSLAKDANAGNISISTALEKYKQSNPHYLICFSYQDNFAKFSLPLHIYPDKIPKTLVYLEYSQSVQLNEYIFHLYLTN